MSTTIQLETLQARTPSEAPMSATMASKENSTANVVMVERPAASLRGSIKRDDGPPGGPQLLSIKQIKTSRIQLMALCWTLSLTGWNDGSTGPLLPRIQDTYHVGFAIASLIFVFACLGFIGGALLNMYLTDKFGFGRTIFFASCLQIIAYSIQASAPPFPVFLMTYAINGAGIALQSALAIGFVGTLKTHAEIKMGILSAAYGLGAFSSPLLATQFAQMPRWSFHYLTSLGLAVSNAIALAAVFRFKDQDECLRDGGEFVPERNTENEQGKFKQVLKIPVVHYLAFFVLIYVGVEVTIGGWIVTFIVNERDGGPSSGYISSGFFGGLMLGRIILLWVNKFVGEWRVIFLYSFLAIGFEFTVWFVPSLIQNAVAVSIVGLLLGPMYPIVMNQASRVLPRWLLTGSIGWISGFGQAGSAVLPFMTGAISSTRGISSLQPLLIGMMMLMTALWAVVPKTTRRTD